MKTSPARFFPLVLLSTALAATGWAGTPTRSSSPVIITRPAINDGSIASRAPFLAARPFDDARRPDGKAFGDNVPPNTAATTPEPLPAPAPKFAILQPAAPITAGSPTGRVGVAVSQPLDAARVAPALRSVPLSARHETVSDIENRIRASETALATMRSSVSEMSVAGRNQFRSAVAEVNAREKPLRRAIRAARKSDDAGWDSARSELAADYESYAQALARIDVAAGITPSAP